MKSRQNGVRHIAFLVLALAMLIAVACQEGGGIQTTPVESLTAPEEPVEEVHVDETATAESLVMPEEPTGEVRADETATVESTVEGLTYQELRRTTPPAPQNLRAVSTEEGVRLDWEPSPAPEIAHDYSDVIVYYNVYRRTAGEDCLLLATASEAYYIDRTVEAGMTYYYAVSAVHEGPVEGERTEEVTFSCSGSTLQRNLEKS